MKGRLAAILGFILLAGIPAGAENYTLRGMMGAEVRYEVRETFASGSDVRGAALSLVIPQDFESPTFRQEIRNVDVSFDPAPDRRISSEDSRGNRIVTAVWVGHQPLIEARLLVTAVTTTGLTPLSTNAPFPVAPASREHLDYLKATDLVQSTHPRIRSLAGELTGGVASQFDAVQRVMAHVVDHVSYVNLPQRFDALYAIESGTGNCQNFSHLSAALLRAAGIPVRIVTGITFNRPYDVTWQQEVMTFKMGQGRHAWIEVWFPDLGWVPFNPQNSMLFVSNRFVRTEVGIDIAETKKDGLFTFRQSGDAARKPELRESVQADFQRDEVRLSGERHPYGPRNLLLLPSVKASFRPLEMMPPPSLPVYGEAEIKGFRFDEPFLYGNLLFPENIDFAFPGVTRSAGGDAYEMGRNFLVETAEYVTTNRTQYAQVVQLQKPVRLEKIGLALHNFGGEGALWVDVFEDRGGKPGPPVAASSLVQVEELTTQPGYRWVDFDFSREKGLLMPGAYWIALGFSGNPIVNWFYTCGKPVGPVHGTRYKGVFHQEWSNALNYEFNYRIQGRTVKP